MVLHAPMIPHSGSQSYVKKPEQQSECNKIRSPFINPDRIGAGSDSGQLHLVNCLTYSGDQQVLNPLVPSNFEISCWTTEFMFAARSADD